MSSYLLLSHIKVHNANALSSALTVGFPALTAFLGFTHQLERLAKQNGFAIRFPRVAICAHDFQMQWHRHQDDEFYSLIGTGNPLNKDGKRSSFIEEPRCDMDLSLLIESSDTVTQEVVTWVQKVAKTMKLAAGDIFDIDSVTAYSTMSEELNDEDFRRLKRNVMPGHWLLDRSDLVRNAMLEGQDAMQAVLQHLKVTCTITKEGLEQERHWEKLVPGWLVPISVGFYGLTPCHFATNQRDKTKEHRFAEAIVTLGEFKMAHRVSSLNDILWGYSYQSENNLYLCKTNFQSE